MIKAIRGGGGVTWSEATYKAVCSASEAARSSTVRAISGVRSPLISGGLKGGEAPGKFSIDTSTS